MKRALLSEAALQQHIVKLLHAYARPAVCWFSVPNGELRNWKVGAKLKQAGLRAGAADLILLADARAHALELKTEIGALSARQLDFKESWERAGGFFHVAFGLDQAIGVLRGINAFRTGVSFTIPNAPNERGVRKGSRKGLASGSPNNSEGRRAM